MFVSPYPPHLAPPSQLRAALAVARHTVLHPTAPIAQLAVPQEAVRMVCDALNTATPPLPSVVVSLPGTRALRAARVPLQTAWYVAGSVLTPWAAVLDLFDLLHEVSGVPFDTQKSQVELLATLCVAAADPAKPSVFPADSHTGYDLVALTVHAGLLDFTDRCGTLLDIPPDVLQAGFSALLAEEYDATMAADGWQSPGET